MNIPIKTAVISLLAISVAAGILLYPDQGMAGSTRYNGPSYIKIIEEPLIDFNMQFGEPGEDPSTKLLGSSMMTGSETEQSILPQDAGKKKGISKPGLLIKLMNYLIVHK